MLIPVVEPKLTLFKKQGKGMRMGSPVFDKASFSISPEPFDPIDVGLVFNELILSMVDSQMLSVTNIDEAIVTTPAIGVDDAIQADLSPNSLLQRGLRAIGNYLSVHVAIAFEDAEDDGFPVSASSSFALDAPCSKERFIYFNLPAERGTGIAKFSQANTDSMKVAVDCVAAQTCQIGDLRGVEINRNRRTNSLNLPFEMCAPFTYLFLAVMTAR